MSTMSGEVYLAEDERGWLVIHESEHGDSSGMEGPFHSDTLALAAAQGMAERYSARFIKAEARRSIATAQRASLRLISGGAHV
jgi:hypothetical protein